MYKNINSCNLRVINYISCLSLSFFVQYPYQPICCPWQRDSRLSMESLHKQPCIYIICVNVEFLQLKVFVLMIVYGSWEVVFALISAVMTAFASLCRFSLHTNELL